MASPLVAPPVSPVPAFALVMSPPAIVIRVLPAGHDPPSGAPPCATFEIAPAAERQPVYVVEPVAAAHAVVAATATKPTAHAMSSAFRLFATQANHNPLTGYP